MLFFSSLLFIVVVADQNTMNGFSPLLLLSCINLVAGPSCQGVRSSFALVGGSFTFPCNATICHHAEWVKTTDTSTTTVATYQNQNCTIKARYTDDFTCEGQHLRLKAAKYSDHGTYKFVCNGTEHRMMLDVLYPLTVNATQKDNITLECHHADDTEDVTWLFNNHSILHYKKDGSETIGKGFEGRASVEKNCFRHGRFSLTITRVQQNDEGIYRCFVNDGTTKGYPHTYQLHINEKRSGQDDSWKILIGVLIVICVCVILGSVISVIFRGKSWSFSSSPRGPSTPDGESNPMLENTLKPTSPTDNRQPVQESSTGDKQSSTRPILYS